MVKTWSELTQEQRDQIDWSLRDEVLAAGVTTHIITYSGAHIILKAFAFKYILRNTSNKGGCKHMVHTATADPETGIVADIMALDPSDISMTWGEYGPIARQLSEMPRPVGE